MSAQKLAAGADVLEILAAREDVTIRLMMKMSAQLQPEFSRVTSKENPVLDSYAAA